MQPKLSVSLIPESAWGKNVRAIVSNVAWSQLRWKFGASLSEPVGNRGGARWNKSSLGNNFLICEICLEHFEYLHLHELWDFDDVKLTQKLVGFKAICEDCHNAIHFGRASLVGLSENSYLQLIKINGWTRAEAEAHVKKAMWEWRSRDRFEYELDASLLLDNALIAKNMLHYSWLSRPRRVRSRLDALAWSQTLLSLPDAVIIDTETTGLIEGVEGNPNAEIIELAIISVNGDVLYNSRFKPIYLVPEHVIEIHGITNQALRKSPSFAKEFQKILDVLDGKIIVAYNSRFDSKIIANTCRLHSLQPPENVAWECAMWAYKGYQGCPQFLKLPNAKHSALADCEVTLELIHKMSKNEEISHPYRKYF